MSKVSRLGAIATLALFPIITTSANLPKALARQPRQPTELAQSPEANDTELEIQQFIKAWGEAWSPRENAAQFSRRSLEPFYWQSEEFLAFDSTGQGQRTVIRGAQAHADMWEPFVRGFQFWTFTPDLASLNVYSQGDIAAGTTMFVDVYGTRPNGEEVQFKAHTTLLLEKQNDQWVIVHENIWGPVREDSETVQVSDEEVVRELTRKWFAGWSVGEAKFTGESLRPLYAQGDGELLVFDNFEGGVAVIKSFQDYLDTWVPVMTDFSEWAIAPEDGIKVTTSGDLATSTFTWIGKGKMQDGEPVTMRQHGTLVWQRRDGTWQIIHEHLTVGDAPR